MSQHQEISGRTEERTLQKARRLLSLALGGADEAGRDAGVRALAHSPDWFPLLPDAINPSGGETSTRVVTPTEYLSLSLDNGGGADGSNLVVDGSLDILQEGDRLFCNGEEIMGTRSIRNLRRATIRGNLHVTGMAGIEGVDCDVTGDLKVSCCPRLRSLRCEVFGNASVRNCGVGQIGADFRCARSMLISHCPKLESFNGEVGGTLTVTGCALKKTGAAMRIGADFVLDDPSSLSDPRGFVNGDTILGKRLLGRGLNLAAGIPDQAGKTQTLRRGRKAAGLKGEAEKTPSISPLPG